jgi:heme-degrading monooxygenase HmoA
MVKAIVQSHVEDYERFHAVFSERVDFRKSHGATGHTIYRSVDDPNTLVVVNDFASADDARAFAAAPELKEAMARAGVEGPQMWIVEEAEAERY